MNEAETDSGTDDSSRNFPSGKSLITPMADFVLLFMLTVSGALWLALSL